MKGKFGVDIKWLAVTSFEMKFGDTTVVSDPFITECQGTDIDYTAVEKCDIITLSHGHWDHVTDIPRLMDKFDSIVLCGQLTTTPLCKWINRPASKIYPMSYDLELDFNDVKIKALFGRHRMQKLGFNDMTAKIENNPLCENNQGIKDMQGVGSVEYLNYLYTAKNGTKVLIWGSNPTVEQINLCKALKPDIAILQRYNQPEKSKELAKFVKEIGCKIVIPHHHDFYNIDPPEVLEGFKDALKKVAPEVEFISPKHGEWINL